MSPQAASAGARARHGVCRLSDSARSKVRTKTGCNFIAGWRSPAARRVHVPEVVGSNPIPATFRQLQVAGCMLLVFCLAVAGCATQKPVNPLMPTRISQSRLTSAATISNLPFTNLIGTSVTEVCVTNGIVTCRSLNAATPSFSNPQTLPYGRVEVGAFDQVEYLDANTNVQTAMRVSVNDPNFGPDSTYTLWGTPDVRSGAWIQLDQGRARQHQDGSWFCELFDRASGNQQMFYRIQKDTPPGN